MTCYLSSVLYIRLPLGLAGEFPASKILPVSPQKPHLSFFAYLLVIHLSIKPIRRFLGKTHLHSVQKFIYPTAPTQSYRVIFFSLANSRSVIHDSSKTIPRILVLYKSQCCPGPIPALGKYTTNQIKPENDRVTFRAKTAF